MKTTGINQVTNFFKQYLKNVDRILEEENMEGAKMVLDDSKKLAPKNSGTMIRETDINKVNEKELEVRYNTDYSLYVHEDLERRHENGEPKFLEKATLKDAPKIFKKVADRVGRGK